MSGLLIVTAVAQQQPQYDNVMGMLPHEAYLPPSSMPVLEMVTSEDGFDNFYLGVDFAEPHMSSNPLNPLEFFNGLG